MEEYPRGPGQLWGGSQSDRRGGRDEDIEQGGLPSCKGPMCKMELRFLSKAIEEEKQNKGSPEPGLLSGNQWEIQLARPVSRLYSRMDSNTTSSSIRFGFTSAALGVSQPMEERVQALFSSYQL